MQTLNQELKEKIETHIKYKELYYVDYRDELSIENLQSIIKSGWIDFDAYINLDYEYESIHEIKKDIKKTFDLSDEFMDENYEYITDIIYDKCSNDPIPDLIKNSGSQPIRVTAYSNYEGIRSDYTYSVSEGYEYSEGFKDIVDILMLDPQTLKKALVAKGFKVNWSFPTIKSRIGKEYVSYEDFVQELNNTMSECNLLTFVGLADVRDFLTHDKKKTIITIPKGNSCGLFDSSCGSGSVIECKLLRDFTVDISTLHGEGSVYDSWSIDIDSQWNGYSIDSVYWPTREFFWKEISVQ